MNKLIKSITVFSFICSFSGFLFADENKIIINKPYKIKAWPFQIFINENEKCYEGEEWHEVMIVLWEGIIIFGTNKTILSETYRTPKNGKNYVLNIIDENNNLISDNEVVGTNCKIEINGNKIIIIFINRNNEIVKQLIEIEDI